MDERKKGFLDALKEQFKGYDTESLDEQRKRRKRIQANSPYLGTKRATALQMIGKGLMKESDLEKEDKEDSGS